jgi:hypothetical protein
MEAMRYELQRLTRALERTDTFLAANDLELAGREMCAALGDVLREVQPEKPPSIFARWRGQPVPQRTPGLLAMLRDELANPAYYEMAWRLGRGQIGKLERSLRDPVIADTLARLGYQGTASIDTLILDTATGLRKLAAVPPRTPPTEIFDQAKASINELRREICQLATTGRNKERLRQRIQRGRAAIAKVLLAAVIMPAVAAVAEHLGLQGAEIIDRLGDLWAVLSLGAVAAIPIAGEPLAPVPYPDAISPAPSSMDRASQAPHLDELDLREAPTGFPVLGQDPRSLEISAELEQLATAAEARLGEIPVSDEIPGPDVGIPDILRGVDEDDLAQPSVDPIPMPQPSPHPPPPPPSPSPACSDRLLQARAQRWSEATQPWHHGAHVMRAPAKPDDEAGSPVAERERQRVASCGTAAVMAARRGPGGGVFDRPVDGVDEPEPIGLEPRQHRRLVG